MEKTFETMYNFLLRRFHGESFLEYFVDNQKICMSLEKFDESVKAVSWYMKDCLKEKKKGSWVGVMHKNHPFWFIIVFGLMRSGYRPILLDAACTDKMIKMYQKKSGFCALISGKKYNDSNVLWISFDELTQQEYCGKWVDEWSDRMAFCTSGTSGTAKVVVFYAKEAVITIKNMISYLENNEYIREVCLNRNVKRRALLTLPMRHVFGYTLPLVLWGLGFTNVAPKNEGILEWINAIKREEICCTYAVPAIWKSIFRILKGKLGDVSKQNFQELFGSQFVFGMVSGARTDKNLNDSIRASDFVMVNSYGSTETHTSITMGVLNRGKASDLLEGYSGTLVNGHEAKLLDKDGKLLDNGKGELVICGKALYRATMVDGIEVKWPHYLDKYYRTGDLFYVEKGIYYYQGRCNNVIINDSGENIYPEELQEDFAFVEGAVNQLCILGIEEQPVMVMLPKNYEDFETSDLFTKIVKKNNSLPMYKRLVKLLIFKESLPLTTKGEVSRIAIEDVIKERKETMKTITLVGKKVTI